MAHVLPDAAKHLVDIGLVDESKVGLMGHSGTGRIVEQALLDSEFIYAAAIAVDYADENYLQSALSGWAHLPGQAPPFNEGLQAWLNGSPAFNAERIRTPLQLDVTSGGEGFGTLLWGWETYSRLKYLQKPVDYYVLPDITKGSHTVQNPAQLLALQSRALDWWLFWLKAEESGAASRSVQFLDWRRLRELHSADLAHPRPPRRTWTVTVQ
jgi:hypothetical protein